MQPIPAFPLPQPANAPTSTTPAPPEAVTQAAQTLESAFLAEMLKASGVGRIGQGEEDPFASFMADAQAQALMARGGIGLTRHIEQALMTRQQGAPE